MNLLNTRYSNKVLVFIASFVFCLSATVGLYAQSKDRIEQAKTKEVIPKTPIGTEIVADVFDEFGGYDTSSNYIMEISSGGQPSPIDTSQSTAHKILAGYVYSAGWPGIVVTSPNGGECLDTGSNYDITWMPFGITKNVNIDYSLDGGSSWHSVASNTANDGIENWHISNDTSSICLVRICDVDSKFCDRSDNYFAIHTECPVPVLTNYGIIVLLILLMGTAVWMIKRKGLATQRNS